MYRPELFIFDMDGLMFDTERISVPCWRAIGRKYGIDMEDSFFDTIFGMNNAKIKEIFLQTYGADFPYDAFHDEKKAMQLAIYHEKGAPAEPGLQECLDYARQEGIRCAVASSSAEETVRLLLHKAGLESYFCHIQSGDAMAHSKPAPDIFLAVCRTLGVRPERALVLEDSGNGLKPRRQLISRLSGYPIWSVWNQLWLQRPGIPARHWQTCRR